MIDKKREEIQSKAVEAWIENGMVGTCVLSTGMRENFYPI